MGKLSTLLDGNKILSLHLSVFLLQCQFSIEWSYLFSIVYCTARDRLSQGDDSEKRHDVLRKRNIIYF